MALEVGNAFVDIQPNLSKGFFAGLSSKLGAGGALLKGAAVGVGLGIAAGIGAGFALFKLGETFDEAFDSLIVATGAAGESLENLKGSFRTVFADIPASAGDVAIAIGEINTRLGLTDEPLEDMSRRFLDLSRITKTDLAGNIENITRVFGDWAIETDHQGFALDQLFKVTQDTGIGIDTLSNTIVTFGAPLRQLGFDFEGAAALTGKWNKEGVNTEAIMAGLKIGLGKLAEESEDIPAAFQEVVASIEAAGSAGEANLIAMETFGARAGPDLAAAVREGRFETEALIESMGGAAGALNDAAIRTESFGEKWQRLVNRVMLAFEPIATKVFEGMGRALDVIGPKIEPFIANIGRMATAFFEFAKPIIAAIQEHFPAFRDALGSVIQIVATLVAPTIALIRDNFADWLAIVVEVAQGITDALVPVAEFIGEFLSIITGLFDGATDTGETFSGAWGEIWGEVMAIFEEAQLFLSAAIAALTAFWEEHGEKILAFVSVVWEKIGVVIEGALRIIRGIFQVFTGLLTGDWSKAWDGIKNIVSGAWAVIRGVVGAAWAAIKLLLRLGLDALALVWDRIWSSLKSAVGTIWDGIVGVIRNAINGLLGVLERGINAALRGLQRAIDVADVLAGPFVNFPDSAFRPVSIARLDEGGNILRGGLAQVHANEILNLPTGAQVTPLDKLGPAMVNVTFMVDGRVLAKASGPYLADELILHSGAVRPGG